MHDPHESSTGSTPDAAPDVAPATPAPPPPPKSSYQLPTRQNTVLRNMVWALALTMAVVVVVGIAFFGVGGNQEREPLENSAVDVAESAARADAVAAFDVTVPAPGADWTERSARFTDGATAQWEVRYSSPAGALVTLVQQEEIGAPLLSSAVPGAAVVEEREIDGATCQVLHGEDEADRALSCTTGDSGILVHGDAEDAELTALMRSALADLRG